MNALDEVPYSYSYQGKLELDQIKHRAKKWNHEYVDSKMIRLLSRVNAFYEEGHVIMDYPFVSFHNRTYIARHVEL